MSNIQKVLIIGKVWPEPASSAAGSRMMQLIDSFKEQLWEVTFACSAGESGFAVDLESYGVNVVNIELNNSSFDEFVSALNPDIVLFDRFMTEEQYGWRVAEQCPGALRVLDTEDLHGLRHGRHKSVKEGREFSNSDLLNEYSCREIASIYRCDLSLIISSFEMKLLNEFFKVDPSLLFYMPFQADLLKEDSWLTFKEREHFVSIGNFLHEPNWDAVRYLKEHIWPLIRKELPDAELHIYGAYPSQKVFGLHNPEEGFWVKGRAEDAAEVISKARVMLAPLRFGAGLKGKLLDAMQAGTPSVTTQVGAEGMHDQLPWAGVIADDPAAFAHSAVSLYSGKAEWESAQSSGSEILKKVFNKPEFKSDLIKKINSLKEDLAIHREQNFTGAMLRHHSLASTRFMGKWIEEKNRK